MPDQSELEKKQFELCFGLYVGISHPLPCKQFFESSLQVCGGISGSQGGGEYQNLCFLGCCAVQSDRSFPIFQRCLLVSTSEIATIMTTIMMILHKTKIDSHVQTSPPLVHILPSYFLSIHFNTLVYAQVFHAPPPFSFCTYFSPTHA
jgi:hypothetical protein